MSELRERLTKAAVEALGDRVYEASAAHATIAEAYWPIIEAELQKRDQEAEMLRAIAKDADNLRWEEANKLLEQTIEVLGDLDMRLKMWPSLYSRDAKLWFALKAKPLLDKLQALKKEPDAHQQAVKEMLAPKPIDHVDGGFKP